jgi:error-prone DNA polymerase
MAGLAREVARAAGEGHAVDLLAGTEALARRCRLDPGADVGLNTVHFPEASVLDLAAGQSLDARLRERCAGGIARCYPGAGCPAATRDRAPAGRRADRDRLPRLRRYFLTVGKVCELIRGLGIRVAARGSGAGSLVNHLLGISAVDPIRHHLLMEAVPHPAARPAPGHRHRRGVRPARRGLRGDPDDVRAPSG